MKNKIFWYCAATLELLDVVLESDQLEVDDMRQLIDARGKILSVMRGFAEE